MRVVAFYQYFVTNDEAGTTRPWELAQRLTRAGDSVTLIGGDYVYFTGKRLTPGRRLWSRQERDGVTILRVHVPFAWSRNRTARVIGFLWFVPVALIASLTVPAPDVVIASAAPVTIGLPALALSRVRRVPFVFELRDLWPDFALAWGLVRNGMLTRAAQRLAHFLYERSTVLICVTKGISELLAQQGIPSSKLRVITNGVDVTLFTPDGIRAELSGLLNTQPDSLFCVHSGSQGLANGLETVLDAADLLRNWTKRPIEFVLLGNGPKTPALRAEVARRGLRNVHFLNTVPKTEVPAVLRACAVGLVSVRSGPLTYAFLPNKFFDYLACGCAVVATYKGECSEWVESAGAGVTAVAADGSSTLADTLTEIATAPDELARMQKKARRLAVEEFSWDLKARDFRAALLGAQCAPAVRRSTLAAGVRRALDIVGAAGGLVVLGLPMLVIGILVRLTSPGPALFRQTRTGLNGTAFTILKFRTMVEARTAGGELLKDGQRLTPFGRFLRRFSLDELPELINVLRGDMGIVGPRPLLPDYLPFYTEREMKRHDVRPGITGWAQVNGRNLLAWKERLEHDVWYVEHRSIALDARIIIRTFRAAVSASGVAVNTEGVETRLDMERRSGSPVANGSSTVST